MILLQHSTTIGAAPTRVFQFLENMPQNYAWWHYDHLSFRWVKGSGRQAGSVCRIEQRIGRDFFAGNFLLTKIIPNHYLELVPSSWLLRQFVTGISIETRAIGRRETQYTITWMINRPIPFFGRLFHRKTEAIRAQLQEESDNLKAILESPYNYLAKGSVKPLISEPPAETEVAIAC